MTNNLRCFNPYSIGSYSGSKIGTMALRIRLAVSILILLEVTLEENVEECIVSIDCLGFNPYSIGSYSGRGKKIEKKIIKI